MLEVLSYALLLEGLSRAALDLLWIQPSFAVLMTMTFICQAMKYPKLDLSWTFLMSKVIPSSCLLSETGILAGNGFGPEPRTENLSGNTKSKLIFRQIRIMAQILFSSCMYLNRKI